MENGGLVEDTNFIKVRVAIVATQWTKKNKVTFNESSFAAYFSISIK